MELLHFPNEILSIILSYTDEFGLVHLMISCKKLRDLVGLSNAWKNLDSNYNFDEIVKYVKLDELYKTFLSINLSKKQFAIKPYYGTWYYLWIMSEWTSCCRQYWNCYKLVTNINETDKLYSLSCHLQISQINNHYDNWKNIIPHLKKEFLKINHSDKDRILQMIYLDPHKYYYSLDATSIYISNIPITTSLNKYKLITWYPFDYFDFPNHIIHYKITFKYTINFDPQLIITKNNHIMKYYYPSESTKAILNISTDLNFDYNTLSHIIKTILAKNSSACINFVDHFFTVKQEKI
jgi:hypothetical protein